MYIYIDSSPGVLFRFQILGEGYEGKVLQARKKDCGVMYALKVLDKQVQD